MAWRLILYLSNKLVSRCEKEWQFSYSFYWLHLSFIANQNTVIHLDVLFAGRLRFSSCGDCLKLVVLLRRRGKWTGSWHDANRNKIGYVWRLLSLSLKFNLYRLSLVSRLTVLAGSAVPSR